MRIAVISSGVLTCPPPGYSGLEQLAWQQAEGLAARGHTTTLFAPEGSRTERAQLFVIGPPGQWDEKRLYARYWQELLQYDVVIDHSWNKWSYILKAEGKLKAPVLGVCHAPVNAMYGSLPPGVANPCFVCISQDQANHFEALFGRKAMVAYNGVDPEFYQPIPGIQRTNRFLFLARFSTIKGADLAIQACKEAGVGLDLVGDTTITNEPEYFQHCKNMCDGEQIRIVGPATRGECVRWFSQAHALIHPNQRFREPFGLAPVEAMLCGCPVIAWDNGAMRETVHRGAGALVKSYEELVNVICNASHELSQSGDKFRQEVRQWATKFSVNHFIDRYEELCKLALTNPW